MTRVALFGGSFNPLHIAHQLVALYVLETCEVDELWFVPTYVHPFGKTLVSYDHRVAMCELACAALGARAKVSRAEQELAQRPGFVASRTLDLVDMLSESGQHTFRLVIGSDILGETSQWYRWGEVVARTNPIVVARAGAERVSDPRREVSTVTGSVVHPGGADGGDSGVIMPDVSATQVRALLASGDSRAAALLPREVLRYIAAHGLYRNERA